MSLLRRMLRSCPLRVVTREERDRVAGSSREDTVQAVGLDGQRATGEWAESYEADARMILDVLEANPDLASNSRRWR